jgi:hypothetical protein
MLMTMPRGRCVRVAAKIGVAASTIPLALAALDRASVANQEIILPGTAHSRA